MSAETSTARRFYVAFDRKCGCITAAIDASSHSKGQAEREMMRWVLAGSCVKQVALAPGDHLKMEDCPHQERPGGPTGPSSGTRMAP